MTLHDSQGQGAQVLCTESLKHVAPTELIGLGGWEAGVSLSP